MKLHFVCKPWEPGCGSTSMQRFFDIYMRQGRDVTVSHSKIINTKYAFRVHSAQYREILNTICMVKPDWVVVSSRSNFDLVKFLRAHGCTNVVVHDQDEIIHEHHEKCLQMLAGHPAIYVQEHRAVAKKFAKCGVLGSAWLPPSFSRYMEPTTKEKKYDIGFLGYLTDYRREFLLNTLPQISDKFYIHNPAIDGMLFGEAVGNFYASCRIVVGLPRTPINLAFPMGTSSRLFQVLGAGSFYMMNQLDRADSVPFAAGIHYENFITEHHLITKAKMYLEDSVNREKIATAGRKEVYRKHLVVHRAEQFWKNLETLTTVAYENTSDILR